MINIRKIVTISILATGLYANSITKEQVCSMIDTLSSGQLVSKDLGNNVFTLNYKDSQMYRFDNYDEYKKWFVECYDRKALINRIIENGKVIERKQATVGKYQWVILRLDNCILKVLASPTGSAPLGDSECKEITEAQKQELEKDKAEISSADSHLIYFVAFGNILFLATMVAISRKKQKDLISPHSAFILTSLAVILMFVFNCLMFSDFLKAISPLLDKLWLNFCIITKKIKEL